MAFRIASAFVEVDADTSKGIRNINQFIAALTAFGPAAGAATAAVVAGVGGIAAAFASAGAAVGAFGLAAGPQVVLMKENAEAATKLAEAQETAARKKALADKLSAQGSDLAGKAETAATSAKLAALDAQKAYDRQTAGLPKATADAALSFAKLKLAYKDWSTSLAGDTMPVFTKALDALRGILPALTPLVKTAAAALSDFMDSMGQGVKSGGFKAFMDKMNESAKTTLPALLNSLKNIGSGFGGIIKAFLPMSGQMAGSLESLTARFAAWGQQLGQSQGFKEFIGYVKTNGPQLVSVVKEIFGALSNIIMALAPFTGASLLLAQAFASIVSNTPAPVLSVLAGIITTLVVAFKLYALYQAAVTLATTIWTASIWASTAALLANPITWIVIAIVALIAVIVLIATKTTWFQTVWEYTWNAIKALFQFVWQAIVLYITTYIAIVKAVFTTTLDVLKATWDAVWGAIKTVGALIWQGIVLYVTTYITIVKTVITTVINAVKATWNAVWGAIKTTASTVWNAITTTIRTAVNAVRTVITAVLNTVKTAWNSSFNTIRSVASSAWNSIKNTITNAINAARNAVTNAVGRISSTVSSIKGKVTSALSGAASWLYNAGRSIIQGLVNGIKSMAGAVKNAVGGVLSNARDLLPFSPAKEGPFSGRGWTLYSGQSMMAGLAEGITGEGPAVKTAMTGTLATAQASIPRTPGTTAVSRGAPSVGELHVHIAGTFDFDTPASRRAAANALVAEMKEAIRLYDKARAR